MMKIANLRRFVLTLAAVFTAMNVFAQTSNVSGIVRDGNSEPVVGAAVMVKGTTVGTLTDADGSYSLKAKGNDVLVFQLFGYKTEEVAINNRGKVDVVLHDDAEVLDATVVVGYGTLKKSQLVGSVESMDGKVIEDRPNNNIAKSLQGQVAGLNIIQVDGKANHSGSIYIRGNATSYHTRASITSSDGSSHSIGGTDSGALVLIDGVEGDLNTVNPSDVESVSVLKDASSSVIYGAKACNGVILVTTKSAQGQDKFSVTYNGTVSINTRVVKVEDNIVTDGLEWTEAFYEFFQGDTRTTTASGTLPEKVNTFAIGSDYLDRLRERRIAGNYDIYDTYKGAYAYYGSTNWLSEFYKRSHTSQIHDINVKGSSKRINYSLSGRYYTQDGVYKIGKDGYDTFSLRSKVKLNVNDWLSIDNNTYMFRSLQTQSMFTNSSALGHQLDQHGQPIFVPYNEDGTYTLTANKTAFASFLEENTGQDDDNTTITSATGIEISFIKNVLKLRGEFAYKGIRNIRERYRAPLTFWLSPTSYTEYVPSASSYKSRWTKDTDYIQSNAVLTWTPKLGENHNLNAVAGWNLENRKYRAFYIQMKDAIYPDMYESYNMYQDRETANQTTQSDSDYSTLGFFARFNYTLFNRYIFEVSGRFDGSSKFPTLQQWGFFPSGSFGWRVSEEPWMKWSRSWLDNFKIRANYGSLGNGTISPYTFQETMAISQTSILIGGKKVPYVTVPSPVPSGLTWETVTTYDLGVDTDFFKNRLSFSGDIYKRKTTDVITNGTQLPAVYGADAPKGNFAALSATGWEATLSWRDAFELGGKELSYSIKGSVWDSRTFIDSFTTLDGNIFDYYEGKELGEIWGFRTDKFFVSNTDANNWAVDKYHKNGSNFREYAGDLRFIDINGDGIIDAGAGTLDDHGDLEIIGNETPRYQFGINMDFKWNGIGLSMFFQGVGKRDWYPMTESAYFYGQYNRPYSFLMKNQTGDNYVHMDYSTENWVVTNADKNPYWTRRVGYSGNRNVGPLTWENDHYLQHAAYIRLKNLTVDYTLPEKITKKAAIDKARLYVSMENIWTWSPIQKYTKNFDPEGIGVGDTDLDSSDEYGLSGIGDGMSYPMLKTFTFGINLTF